MLEGSILETVLYNGDKKSRIKTMQSSINRRDCKKEKGKGMREIICFLKS